MNCRRLSPIQIQAVPAFMDVDTIISPAALAGCDVLTIEPESGYPLMSGATVKIHFRRDPFLGWIASFEHYEFKGGPKKAVLDKV